MIWRTDGVGAPLWCALSGYAQRSTRNSPHPVKVCRPVVTVSHIEVPFTVIAATDFGQRSPDAPPAGASDGQRERWSVHFGQRRRNRFRLIISAELTLSSLSPVGAFTERGRIFV